LWWNEEKNLMIIFFSFFFLGAAHTSAIINNGPISKIGQAPGADVPECDGQGSLVIRKKK
jgi:hypothetical protein